MYMNSEKKTTITNKIVAYSTVGLCIATIGLLIVTAIYASLTRSTVNLMEKEFNVSNRPIITIDGLKIVDMGDYYSMRVVVQNRGKVEGRILSFEHDIIPGTLEEPVEALISSPIVYPGEIRLVGIATAARDQVHNKLDIHIKLEYINAYIETARRDCVNYHLIYQGDPEGDVKVDVEKCGQ